MSPPDVWIQAVLAEGIETSVYPFIYPPLWAWAMSWIIPITSMDELGRTMGQIVKLFYWMLLESIGLLPGLPTKFWNTIKGLRIWRWSVSAPAATF